MTRAIPAPRHPLDHSMDLVEERAGALRGALLAGDAQGVATASAAMQQAVQVVAEQLQRVPAAAIRGTARQERLRALGRLLAEQREGCLRRGAVVERSLHSLIPATRGTTYGGGATPYAQLGARTGAIRRLAA